MLLQAPLSTDLSAEEEPLAPPPQPAAASADEGEGIDLSGVAAAIGQDANSAGTQVWTLGQSAYLTLLFFDYFDLHGDRGKLNLLEIRGGGC